MSDEDELEKFDRGFNDILNEMAREINPQESKNIFRRGGLGKLIDLGVLLRRGFQQSWQFIVIVQALWIFLGLSPQVSRALDQVGISISGFWIGLIAVITIVFFFGLGMILLLRGGSQRTKFLINQKQNPAQRMDYHFYHATAQKLQEIDERLDKIEGADEDE